MSEGIFPPEVALSGAGRAFVRATSTASGQHIKPLHRYLAMRLVREGGFLPEEVVPRPPFRSEHRSRAYHLDFDPGAPDTRERVVLGGLRSKRIDVVVVKRHVGPVLAISAKGTSKAVRNLVNRVEEAIGDCANIHIMCPGLVYG